MNMWSIMVDQWRSHVRMESSYNKLKFITIHEGHRNFCIFEFRRPARQPGPGDPRSGPARPGRIGISGFGCRVIQNSGFWYVTPRSLRIKVKKCRSKSKIVTGGSGGGPSTKKKLAERKFCSANFCSTGGRATERTKITLLLSLL